MPPRVTLVFLIAIAISCVWARSEEGECEVRALTSAGWVCGKRLSAANNKEYASFRGLPYAKQPLGELRFKELEPPEPWSNMYDATKEGDICPQTDVFYGPLMTPRGMSEKCIFANVHVPLEVLRDANKGRRLARQLEPPIVETLKERTSNTTSGAPILVFIHGGGFAFGSGDSDLHGPEHLVGNNVIVITFNYRLNVLGFLSLNSTQVPGNNGLRDMVTLLRWVRVNARNFGGDPEQVTLAGQSAGAASAHLLTLSPEAKGLFKKVILMSGTAIPTFYTTSPAYARFIANAFVTGLGITSTDPAEIHQQLVDMPIERLQDMHKALLDQNGLGVFYPVIEAPLPGVKRILTEDPEVLIANGQEKDIPILIGFTNVECESFRKRFMDVDVEDRIKKNPLILVPLSELFSGTQEQSLEKSMMIQNVYFRKSNYETALDQFVKYCSDAYMDYPALRLTKIRSMMDGANTFLYQFSYDRHYSPLKKALKLDFLGAGHVEDLMNVFKVHSVPVPPNKWDESMESLMTSYVINFMIYGHPTGVRKEDDHFTWRPVGHDGLRYHVLHSPTINHPAQPTKDQYSMLAFFDSIRGSPR